MTLKKITRIDEAPMDFVRGAAGMAGQKAMGGVKAIGQGVANGARAVGRQAGEIAQAGAAQSAQADIQKAAAAFAQAYAQYAKLPKPPAQAQPEEQGEQQAAAPAANGAQQGAGAPDAFRTTQKPRGTMGQHGFQYTFNSFLADISGEEINEGAWDFIKGAGGAIRDKAAAKMNDYSKKDSIFKDIYHAGAAASQAGDVTKIKSNALAALKNLIAVAQRAGPNGRQIARDALMKASPDQSLTQTIVGVFLKNMKTA